MTELKEIDNHTPIIKLKEAFEYIFTVHQENYIISISDFNKVFDIVFKTIPKNKSI